MLRLSVTASDGKTSLVGLKPSSIIYEDSSKERLRITAEDHGMTSGDTVRFFRSTPNGSQAENVDVEVVDKDNFTIPVFPDMPVAFSSIGFEEVVCGFQANGEVKKRWAMVMHFDDIPHDFLSNPTFSYITREIFDDYYRTPETQRTCVGDHVLFSGFVFNIGEGDIDENGRYIIGESPVPSFNYRKVKIHFHNSDDDRENVIENGYVQILSNGLEDRTKVIFFIINVSVIPPEMTYLVENQDNIEVFSDDRRFIIPDGEEGFSLIYDADGNQVSFLSRVLGRMCFNLPFSLDFAPNLMQNEVLNPALAEQIALEKVNPIVDFERRTFTPVRYDGSDFSNIEEVYISEINEVTFNLHFRERMEDSESGGVWRTNDTLGWNNYTIATDSEGSYLLPKRNLGVDDADLLSYLGYTDGDVYYQRNNLKKSFIRLSFYDSPYRKDQNLLFYSTMFYDSGEAFLKYVKARALTTNDGYYTINGDEATFVSNEYTGNDEDKSFRLSARFSASDNLDMMHSSEGFYTYFYPSTVKGKVPTTVYMKVEFNHAKYGRVVPFVLPSIYSNTGEMTVIDPESDNFPLHYMKTASDGTYEGVDWERLNSDMYIRVMLKYDAMRSKYVWFLPRNRQSYEEEGKLVLNLFEPRVNGYETTKEEVIPEEPSYDGTSVDIIVNFTSHSVGRFTFGVPMMFTMGIDGEDIYRSQVSGNKTITLENQQVGNASPKWTFSLYNYEPNVPDGVNLGRETRISYVTSSLEEVEMCDIMNPPSYYVDCVFTDALSKMVVTTTEGGVQKNRIYLNVHMGRPDPMRFMQEVEYLEATGTQYIDTGVIPKYSTRFVVDEFSINPVGEQYTHGSYLANGEGFMYYMGVSQDRRFFHFGIGSSYNWPMMYSERRYTIEINGNGIAKVNGTSIAVSSGITTGNYLPVFLFASNSGSSQSVATAQNFLKGKVYSSKIYEGNFLVRDFVPVVKDGVAYMFDKITETLYGNKGTGEFIAGPVVN